MAGDLLERWRGDLEGSRVNELDYTTKRHIVVMVYKGDVWKENGWRGYANQMGIVDEHRLTEIEVSAMTHNELPLFMVIDRVIGHRSINVIIDCMRNMQRRDILDYLEGPVSGLLNFNVDSD